MSRQYIPSETYYTIVGEKDMEVPKHYCKSCTKRCGNMCNVFNRRVELDYNKCVYHTLHEPTFFEFKSEAELIPVEQVA